jgi:hypothetical protein
MNVSIHRDEYPSIVIIEGFLSDAELNHIVERCSSLTMFLDQIVTERIVSRADLFDVDAILSSRLEGQVANDIAPTEYRVYYEGSNGFDWHRDQIFEEIKDKYYEASLTLTDTSDCRFEYVEDGSIRSLKLKPNTLVLVKPFDAWHRVSPLNHGRRTFLKFLCRL